MPVLPKYFWFMQSILHLQNGAKRVNSRTDFLNGEIKQNFHLLEMYGL